MDEAEPIIRREPLTRLRDFCAVMKESIQQGGLTAEQAFAVFDSSIAAECIQCHIQISGKELFEVATERVESQQPGPKIMRMRLGDCARQGCDSMYYNLTLQPYPRVQWSDILARAEGRELEESGVLQIRTRRQLPRVHMTPQTARTAALVAGAVLVLFVARQFYYGGRIPLIREPEHFRVDHISASRSTEAPQPPEYLRE